MNVTQDKSPKLKWSHGEAISVPACPGCGGLHRHAALANAPDMMLPTRMDRWSMWTCHSCASVWLDPRPAEASLPAAYDFDYYTHSPVVAQQTRPSWVWRLINGYLRTRFRMPVEPASKFGNIVMRCLPPLRLKLDYYGRHLRGVGRRLLDVGCGNGEFLARARDMGWEVHGVDPDPAAVAAGQSRGLQITHGTLADISAPDNSDAWDVITLSHSIEHVTQPKIVLSQILSMLRPGGYVWMAWPNPQSVGRFYCGRYWESFDPPRHLCLYSRRAMRTFLAEAGFESIKFRRRGSHAGRIYRVSAEASQRNGGRSWRFVTPIRVLATLVADLIATIDPRWSEELVVTASKPRT